MDGKRAVLALKKQCCRKVAKKKIKKVDLNIMKYPLMRNNFDRTDLDEVINLLKQDDPRLTNGTNVQDFESAWSNWLGVRFSVFVNSGSSANLLSLALLKHRFPEGGEVIVPPLTWASDISSVLHTGFTPVFADVDRRTLGMDTAKILEAITDKTRAVFLSHIQGFNALTDKLLDTLTQRGIALIEDVCESHGVTHKGRRVGSFGWTSNFSFYYAHHMSTIEGGMICTDDEDTYRTLRMLRSHGMVRENGCSSEEEKWVKKNTLNSIQNSFFLFPPTICATQKLVGCLG